VLLKRLAHCQPTNYIIIISQHSHYLAHFRSAHPHYHKNTHHMKEQLYCALSQAESQIERRLPNLFMNIICRNYVDGSCAGDFSVSLLAARVAWRSKLHLFRNQQEKYIHTSCALHLRPVSRELIRLAAR
jgi:hypothetical protein